jgi:hypothetical protein
MHEVSDVSLARLPEFPNSWSSRRTSLQLQQEPTPRDQK